MKYRMYLIYEWDFKGMIEYFGREIRLKNATDDYLQRNCDYYDCQEFILADALRYGPTSYENFEVTRENDIKRLCRYVMSYEQKLLPCAILIRNGI